MPVSIELRIVGLGKLIDLFDSVAERMKSQLMDLLDVCAEMVKETAQQLVPVRTGFLRASITVFAPDAWWRVISATAIYSVYVEFGTWCQAARAFMIPALLQNKQRIIDMVRSQVKVGLR